MTGRLAVRRTGHARRPRGARGPRRASARISPLRAGAALVMLLSALAIYGVGASSAFAFRQLEIEGTATGDRLTSDRTVAEELGLAPGAPNLFLLATDELEDRLRDLPTLTGAQVTVRLPDTVHVRLEEREPILTWVVGARRFLVDRDGTLFASVPSDDDGPTARLPSVADTRVGSRRLSVGDRLDPVDLDAATRLGGIRSAEDLGSDAYTLALEVDDKQGFVMAAQPQGWNAVFGFYTPNLRKPDMIPGQIRLLRSFLAGRETKVARVFLSSATDGTYITR